MKTLYSIACCFSLILVIQSCKTVNLASVSRGSDVTAKLPPLKPEFDINSFRNNYDEIYSIPGRIIRDPSPVNVSDEVDKIAQTYTIAEDTKRIFNSIVLSKLCDNVGATQGYAVCRQGLSSRGFTSVLNPVVSWLTLGVANLFGFKYATVRDELEIVVDIYDLDNQVVGSFTGVGTGEADVRAYKGYSLNGAKRMAHAKAFIQAMEQINRKIVGQRSELIAALN